MVEAGAKQIRDLFAGDTPFFIGRNGTIEIETVFFWILKRPYTTYPERIREQIQRNAGIFPNTDASIDAWCEAYVDVLTALDGTAASWYKPLHHLERTILDRYAPNAFRCPLRSLEPYYVDAPLRWTIHLSGKKVAIVSSFADSIKKQLWGEKTSQIWRGAQEGMLPGDVEWSFVKTGYSPTLAMGRAGWPNVTTWQGAVDYVVEAVVATKASVAIIGCGGLGMVIAGRLRQRGISVIVLGGAIQILFGVKGGRWKNHDIISKFWNDAWTWPTEEETPNGASMVEGGCYWLN